MLHSGWVQLQWVGVCNGTTLAVLASQVRFMVGAGHSSLTLADKHDLPAIHGEISVEHLLAHLLPLNSPGKFQVRELISEQVGLHKALKDRQ